MGLDSGQKFYITFFSDGPVPMSEEPRFPVQALPAEKVRTFKWLKTIHPLSGTEPQSSVEMLANMKLPTMYLLSDGDFGPLSPETYRLLKDNKVTVNTVAFEDPEGKVRLAEIARNTGGKSRYVPVSKVRPPDENQMELRLACWLIDGLRAPPPSDPQPYRDGLRELAEGQQDFGPQPNAPPPDVRRAADDWLDWWAKNRILPSQQNYRPDDLLKELNAPLSVLRQAARLSLIERCGEDCGPPPDASDVERAQSVAKWRDCLKKKEEAEQAAALAKREAEELAAKQRRLEQERKSAPERLRLANNLFDAFSQSGRLTTKADRNLIKRRFQDLIDKFPGSDQAAEAERKLKLPELQDPKPGKTDKTGK